MASLKKLAGQTAWYGLSSIFARLLNYLLTPYLTHYLNPAIYGEMTLVYAAIPFMNVLFTYGMETTFFRFSNKDGNEQKVYDTGSLSLIFTTLLFTVALLMFKTPLAAVLRLDDHPQFITWTAYIIALDALCTLPFAKLRNDNRPRKYAFIRLAGILVNIAAVVFFYSILPGLAHNHPHSFIARWYDPTLGAGYVIIANIIMSGLNFIMLLPEFLSIRIKWDNRLWSQMMLYSLPIMIAGFGGMINETFDRVMLGWWGPGNEHAQKVQVGIYGACYKLSLLITLFIQAFRLGAEPFFFQQAREEGEGAKHTYARVMKFFVITVCSMFLFVTLYLDFWKHFISKPIYWQGLKVVPILLVANMCLGVYYNLSIWYKLSNSTRAGATITIIGAVITLIINYLFIPHFSYMACAWATFSCYASMMLISYFWGQARYPVPYAVKRMLGYFAVMMALYAAQLGLNMLSTHIWMHFATGTALMLAFLFFIIKAESKELKALPVVGKYIR